MKYIVFAIAIATSLMQGAAHDVACTECTARQAAQLPDNVERVLKAMNAPSIKALEGVDIEVEYTSDHGCERIKKPILETSLGKLYHTLDTQGYNSTLTSNRKVVKKGNKFFKQAYLLCPVEVLLSSNMFDEELTDCLPEKPAETDPARVKENLPAYVRMFGGQLKQLLQEAIENPVKIDGMSVGEVIKDNAEKILSEEDRVIYMAAQLATAFSLRLQLKRNPTVYHEKFAALLGAPTE